MLRRIPRQPEVNIGTAGHVDHGKTTMVEAITGIWTSAHSEELKRGITIKVGYADAAFYRCPSCEPPQAYGTSTTCSHCGSETQLLRVVSFVDCPGHESLMANMLSGAAVMDGAILVIAADERIPQPQTREHLLALQMLGMKDIVVAHNKLDLVSDERALEGYKEIKDFVKGSVAEEAPIIPISAQQKANIDALIQAIQETIPTPTKRPDAPPLMQVLRSFDVNKPGTPISKLQGGVLGGTLLQGELRVGDEVELRPGLLKEGRSKYQPVRTVVASLGTGAGLVEKVSPGGLIAVGTKLDPSFTKGDALVGSVLGRPEGLPPILDNLTLETQLFETAVGAPEMVKVEKIRKGEALRLNVGTAVTLAIVKEVYDGRIDVELRRPVCVGERSRAAISRRIGDRWRLIGSGIIQ